MKDKRYTFGQPTEKHQKVLNHTPALIVDIDLTYHTSSDYPKHGSDAHKDELLRVKRAYENPKNSKEYQDAVDHSVKAPFKVFCKENNIEYPKDLLKSLNKDAKYYVMILKYHFNRPRPYQVAEKLGIPFEKGESFSSGTPAYPSGHSTQARMFATVLGRLFPRYKKDFDIIADSIDRTRLDLGVHYPSDIAAGKKLGKHLGLVCNLSKPTRLAESPLTDPADANIKMRVGLRIQLPPEVNVTDAIDAIKAIRDVSTARQFGAQEEASISGKTTINLYVTVVGGKLSPERLLKNIKMLDDIISAYIKNVDGEKYYASPRRERRMRRPANESLVKELVREIVSEAVEMDDEMYARIADVGGRANITAQQQSQIMAFLTKKHYQEELGSLYRYFSGSTTRGTPIAKPSGKPSVAQLVAALNRRKTSLNTEQISDYVKQKGGTAEHSFFVNLAMAKDATHGNNLERAIAGYVNFISPGAASAQVAGAAGEDLVIDGIVCEVKSSKAFKFTAELNASSFAPDPQKAYLYVTDSTSNEPKIFIISSHLLHQAYTYGASSQARSDGSDLETEIDQGLDAVLGDLSLKDFVTKVVVTGKPQDLQKSFNIPGTSLNLRIRINFSAKKLKSLDDAIDVRLVNSGGILTEELTKTDKKEIERIAKKTVKKEIEAAMRDFKKSELEKEITKVLGGKASKEELSKVTKAVIKRLYRELSINYPAIIDRIKV